MYYARLKPFNPRQGYTLNRYHFMENLFIGGERPTWYRVDDALAAVLKLDTQESGRFSFDVLTPDEKHAVDKIEEERRMVALGMMSATFTPPAKAGPVDLVAPRASRAEAIPESKTSRSEGGDLTSADVKSPLAE